MYITKLPWLFQCELKVAKSLELCHMKNGARLSSLGLERQWLPFSLGTLTMPPKWGPNARFPPGC